MANTPLPVRAGAIIPADVLGWVQAMQPPARETFVRYHGRQRPKRGALDVRRHGIAARLQAVAQTRGVLSALSVNTDILARHATDRAAHGAGGEVFAARG